ncbi:kinase-like protein [Cucurbitaria berberidis CBS 394.84]|uniref:Autophagy-related protein 1 n=1 Tax=Cucurbitaria berberidis CBS 394.84 TaxID=1168544 RepID=A0A9P4GNN9_9PLEO|nr:kinase-like protein [Cucurbitaria berberidis CBS 394.84]KAF1848910.1 kinase-like protein [Cucurbitaria berberidis CBS 394.84]
MAAHPLFVAPYTSRETDGLLDSPATTAEKRIQPQLQLSTSTESSEGYTPAVIHTRHSKPQPSWTISTPPDSPTRLRSSNMGAQDSLGLHDSGAMTPPITPTSASRTRSDSVSDYLSTLSSLRRGDSTSSSRSSPRVSFDMPRKPRSTETINFPYQFTEYEFMKDAEGKRRTIGKGLWSNVYLAKLSLPKPTNQCTLTAHGGAAMTPPLTPINSQDSSLAIDQLPAFPLFYAIKVPASTGAKQVLAAEAKVLSHLSSFPDAARHIVSFYGLDTRTGALVLKAMDGTLETWIEQHLNTLDETSRAQKLATVFPAIARSLLTSLIWMQDKHCIHADIKPSNILVSRPSSTIPTTVFSDFSSTILTSPTSDTTVEPSPVGAGTWDYLDPSLLSTRCPASPSATTDLWSLAITLLFLVIGTSPFDAFKSNKFQQREMIKAGAPLQCLAYGDEGIRNVGRLKALSGELGFDVQNWFARAFVKDREKRVEGVEWRGEIEVLVAARM